MATVSDKPEIQSPLRPARRLRRQTSPDVRAIAELYVQGHTGREIAKIVSIPRGQVGEVLTAAGIARRDGRIACPAPVVELRGLYEELGVAGLSRRFGVGRTVVDRWLVEAGIVEVVSSSRTTAIRELYLDQRLPVAEVARRLGTSASTIRSEMVRAGIPARPSNIRRLSEQQAAVTDERLREVYVVAGLSEQQAADELGVSRWYLRKRLAEAGIAKRPGPHRPRTGYTREQMRYLSTDLYENCGKTVREAAAVLGVNASTVAYSLNEARARVRPGGLPDLTDGTPQRRLIDALYADPDVEACLRRYGVHIPEPGTWHPAAPTESLAPLPLSPVLVAELYELGLATFHIALLCGVGRYQVCSRLREAGVTPRPAGGQSPWLAALNAQSAEPQ